MFTASIRPPHPIVFLTGKSADFAAPEVERGKAIAQNSTCVLIMCRNPQDAPTTIVMAPLRELSLGRPPTATARIAAPRGFVALITSHNDEIFRLPVRSPSAIAAVWVDHPTEPDEIVIGVE